MASQAKHSATTRVDWSEIARAKSAGVTIIAVETRGYATRYIIENTPRGGGAPERCKEDAKAEAVKPEPERADAEKPEPGLTAKQRRSSARQKKFEGRLAAAFTASQTLVQEVESLKSDSSQPAEKPKWVGIAAAPAPSSPPPEATGPKPTTLAEKQAEKAEVDFRELDDSLMQMMGTELDLALWGGAADSGWQVVEQKPGGWRDNLWNVTSPAGERFGSLEAAIRAMAAKADEPMGCGAEKCSEAAAGGEQMGGGAEKRSKAAAGVQTPTKPLPTSNEQSWTPAGKSRKKALPPSGARA